MRIVFCGTPEFAVPSLGYLRSEPGITIEAVITQPDRPRGRGQHVQASIVKRVAIAAGLHVYQPESIKSDSTQDFLRRVAPDAVVIIAYGQIVPARLLNIPRLGWINLHASLLPRYRGAAPINWAIVNGEARTGLSTMQIDSGMDTGPILLQRELDIDSNETATDLTLRMAHAGPQLLIESLWGLDRGEITPKQQDSSNATYAPMLKKEDGRIDWALTAQQIFNRMRGFDPWPGVFTTFRGQNCQLLGRMGNPEIIVGEPQPGQILASSREVNVICGQRTVFHLELVHIEGRKRVSPLDFANGARLAADERFV